VLEGHRSWEFEGLVNRSAWVDRAFEAALGEEVDFDQELEGFDRWEQECRLEPKHQLDVAAERHSVGLAAGHFGQRFFVTAMKC